jgi:hypothetical protein
VATQIGWVAQLAEQRTENPRVGGSIPPPATPPDAIKPMARPDEVAALPSAGAAKTPDHYRRISLGQIQLKLNSNEKGTLNFEVHNRIGWMLRGISINMH